MPTPSAAELAAARLPLARASSLPPGCYLDPALFAREEERIFRREWLCDGRLLGAPDMERAEGFERGRCRLPELRVETWLGWIFASFDPDAAPLAPRLEGLRRVVEPYRPEAMRTGGPLVFEHDWNWKGMVENFVESYHHQGTHGDTLQPIVPASGTHADDADGPWVALHNPTKDGAPFPALFPETPGLGEEERAVFVVGAVFPFHLFSVQRDSLIWYRLEPHAVDRFTLHIHPCVPPPRPGDAEHAAKLEALRGGLDGIHRQDIAACQGVQRGLRSRLARAGRLSHLEKALWQFDQFVLDRVAPEPA